MLRGQGDTSSRPRTSWRTPPLVYNVEQEREQEVFIEINDFDDCAEEKEDADFLTN